MSTETGGGEAPKTALQALSLSYAYGGGPLILDGLSAEIRAGEFVGILGTNGTGKSTFLRLMAGLLRPRSGKAVLKGRDIASLSRRQIACELAFVPQEPSVWLPFTCREVVSMGRYVRSSGWKYSAEDLEIAERCMRETRTLELADRRVCELSGGELQRVCIAQALAQETEILMLDEPTSHLDISFQLDIMELLAELQRRRNLTVAAVLHDLNLAAQFCSRLLILNGGGVFADGSPAEVLTSDNLRRVFKVEADISSEGAGPRIWLRSSSRSEF
ncbi:ABC transporter ATP-binding protein [bacterium]|nr:ABC transporter ATP-binding protein [bacterium]